MDNTYDDGEKLFRAVYPPSHPGMFWKKDGTLSSSAFADRYGLSVERGYYRDKQKVIDDMKEHFSGCIVSVNVGQCRAVEATVKYLPTKRSKYHSEIHGSDTKIILNKSQRKKLSEMAIIEYHTEKN